MTPRIFKYFSLIILLFSMLSCASKRQVTAEDIIVIEETKTIETSKILFLNYLLVKNTGGKKSITLINQINTEGKLKGKPENIPNATIGDLEYMLLDKDFKAIKKYALKNPLKKTVEFVNDYGNFEKKVLDLDSVQFSIRMQVSPEAKHIVISEITNAAPIKHLTTKID
ncbi:hypothetical protein [Lacinutrix sp. MEBiC02595]